MPSEELLLSGKGGTHAERGTTRAPSVGESGGVKNEIPVEMREATRVRLVVCFVCLFCFLEFFLPWCGLNPREMN